METAEAAIILNFKKIIKMIFEHKANPIFWKTESSSSEVG